jgi:acetolactate synthase-1/2/3 large subunit
MVLQAFKEAQTERPGATYLGIPEDTEAFFDFNDLLPLSPYDEVDTEPASNQIKRAAEVL